MKRIGVLIIILIFPLISITQPGKASTIIINTNDKIEKAEKTVINLLIEEGYGLYFYDRELHIISTTPHGYSFGTMTLNISLIKSDSTKIQISGSFDIGVTNGKIMNRGMKGSAMKDAWQEMHTFALLYKNGRLSYE